MLKLLALFALVASAFARPQHIQLPFTFAAAPQHVQHAAPSAALTAVAAAPAPAPAVPQVPPANFVSGNTPDGSSVFGFQTIDGQARSESVGADGSVRGSYSYVDANGQAVTINYVADQQGFRTSVDPIAAGGARPATTPAPPAPQPAPQAHALPAFTFQLPQVAQVAPAPTTPAPATVHSFTPFISPLPANTLPLGHFGFQPLAAAPQPAIAAAAPAPQPVAVQAAAPQALNPIAYSFNTGRR